MRQYRNDTFRTCIDALNRAKGRDTKFEYIKAEPEMLTLGLNGKYAIYFWREDLAKAVGKAGQDVDF